MDRAHGRDPGGSLQDGLCRLLRRGGTRAGRGGRRFAIDRGPVTVEQFARFVDETGYLTVAERPPDRPTTPTPIPHCWSKARRSFTPLPGRSRSMTRAAGGPTFPAPTGATPGARAATTRGAMIIRSRMSPTKTPRRTRRGRARRCRARPSGSTRREAASKARSSPGATRIIPAVS